MAERSKIEEFPDISSKLTAPSKKSLFERQKAEAEAKREREKKETAAVYEDFVKSFDNEDDDDEFGLGALGGGQGLSGPPKRHFGGSTSFGGRGGLGGQRGGLGGGRGTSGPGSLGPVPSTFSKKRPFEEPSFQRNTSQGLFNFNDAGSDPTDTKTAFRTSDDEEEAVRAKSHEKAAPKPTIHLSSLPPGTSQAVVKSIIPASLQVENVRILPPAAPSGSSSTERRSLSAIITLAKDTPAIDIDTVVSALQNKYLGWGFHLSLSRHLSSAALGTTTTAPFALPTTSALPFGAKPVPIEGGRSFTRAPPPGPHRGGFAPPSSYNSIDSAPYGRNAPATQVNVSPPTDLKQLKLIHKMIEAILTHGPEFEALLMSRPEVQKDQKWAWLWDSRSQGGVWYRWRLWDILTGAKYRIRNGTSRNSSVNQEVFRGEAPWVAPERMIPHEYITKLEELVSDSDYNSSDEDDSGDEGRRRYQHLQGGAPIPETMLGTDADSQSFLNPLQKAKLIHLLARLPDTTAKLRRGDVARVTAFAIQHASEGAEEVVSIITSNVNLPFSSTSANPDRRIGNDEIDVKDEDEAIDGTKKSDKEDTSSSKLIALYVVSDILSSSSTSGVRHAWRYRQLFEAALRKQKIFEGLGRLERVLSWGRLRAEKWKRSVTTVLSLWEGWCVFSQASQEFFTQAFLEPPLTAKEEETRLAAEKAAAQNQVSKSKWKTVEKEARQADEMDLDVQAPNGQGEDDVDGEHIGNGARLDDEDEDEDIDGESMEDVDGEPMADEDVDGEAMDTDGVSPQPGLGSNSHHPIRDKPDNSQSSQPPADQSLSPNSGRRRRPKAEDMFADSDSS